jgi:hypothetical protein
VANDLEELEVLRGRLSSLLNKVLACEGAGVVAREEMQEVLRIAASCLDAGECRGTESSVGAGAAVAEVPMGG